MAGSTAKGFYDNLMLDLMPSSAQMADFGIDMATDRDALMRAYQRKIKNGSITLAMLEEAKCDGEKLSNMLGMQVETVWDDLFIDDDGDLVEIYDDEGDEQ